MRRRIGRIVLIAGLISLVCLVVAIGGVWWRLEQGPISLTFLKDRVERMANDAMASTGLFLSTSDIVLERDEDTGMPILHMRDVKIRGEDGRILVQAPKGAVGIDGGALLKGRVRLKRIDLIGPRIVIHRRKDGLIEVGFRESSGSAQGGKTDRQSRSATPDIRNVTRHGKADDVIDSGSSSKESAPRVHEKPQTEERALGQEVGDLLGLQDLFDFIEREIFGRRGGDALFASLQALHIRRASISYYDEIADILLFTPKADLQFRRVPYGFVLYAEAGLSSGGKTWRTEFTARFLREDHSIQVSMRVFDVIIADVASNVFAVSQLAQMRVPVSGHLEMRFTRDAGLQQATAELTVGKGTVYFPGYIARPAKVQEGLLRIDYRPKDGAFVIHPSFLSVNGTPMEMKGHMTPVFSGTGRLKRIGVHLEIGRGNIQAPHRKGEIIIDQIVFQGQFRVDAAEVKVEDFLLRSGKSWIRMQGRFVGEREGIGVYVGGRGGNITARVVKKLWPPIVSPGARAWIREHLKSGLIPQGTFQLAMPGRVIKAAIERDVPVPDAMARIAFSVRNVAFDYLEGLPDITGAAGTVTMSGNHFTLVLDKGRSQLPSGARLTLVRGVMKTRELARKVSPSRIDVEVQGAASTFVELLDLPPLKLPSKTGFGRTRVNGKADVRIHFSMPLSRSMRPEQIRISAEARIRNAQLSGLPSGFKITGGTLDLSYADNVLRASGNVKLDGMPASLSWQRRLTENYSRLHVGMTLSDRDRQRLGADFSPWITGPIRVSVDADEKAGKLTEARVKADLSHVAMRLGFIGWSRPAHRGTRARLRVVFTRKGRILIRDLAISGPGGLHIAGRLDLKEGRGLIEATLPRLELDSLHRLAVGLSMRGKRLEVGAAGQIFDARPLIRRYLSEHGAKESPEDEALTNLDDVRIQVNIARIVAERGEMISDVRGIIEIQAGHVARMSLQGRLSSGHAVSLDLTPAADGLRRLRVLARDAGAVLRASGLYSRIAGGEMDFSALLKPDGSVQRGLLVIRHFEVRNEARLANITRKSKRRGPRRGLRFKKLILPFSTDENFVRIGNALIKGKELGATANGLIRKRDLAMDIGGTIIPAYAVNAAIGKVPIIGDILTGGGGKGVFGLTFALRGTMKRPRFVVNPVSAIAPGIFREFFQIGGHNVNPDGTPKRKGIPRRAPASVR